MPAVPTDKRDIPGFARSDIFLTEAHFLTGFASPHGVAFLYRRKQKSSTADTVLQFSSINFYAFRRSVFFLTFIFYFRSI